MLVDWAWLFKPLFDALNELLISALRAFVDAVSVKYNPNVEPDFFLVVSSIWLFS